MYKYFLFLYLCYASAEITDKEYSRFPRLFHLDDHQHCQRRGGARALYCEGSFHLQPAQRPHWVFQMMQKYSQTSTHFNRTLLHRGYCVSERCPELLHTETSAATRTQHLNQEAKLPNGTISTLRSLHSAELFERCVAKFTSRKRLIARVSEARCSSGQERAERLTRAADAPETVFKCLVIVILLLNVVGTAYEVRYGREHCHHRWLASWSARSSWRALVSPSDRDAASRALRPLQGLRVVTLALVLLVHVIQLRFTLYHYWPERLEQMVEEPVFYILTNSVTFMHTFVMISSFLTTYFILLYSETHQLSLKFLPFCMLKRFIRLAPTHLLAVGYAATWWVYSSEGPLWARVVGSQRDICREKFWLHVLHVNNLIDNQRDCLIPTWSLAADMQLSVLVSALALTFSHLRRRAIVLYGVLFLVSSALVTAIAHANGWKSIMYKHNTDKIRQLFANDLGFRQLYTSTWVLLPASFYGLFFAHLHYELQKVGFDSAKYKWLVRYLNWATPLAVAWTCSAYLTRHSTWPVMMVGTLSRAVFCVSMSGMLLVAFNFKGSATMHGVMAWRGWRVLARLTLALLPVHWLLGVSAAASTQHAVTTSHYSILSDWVVNVVGSYLLTVPLVVLFEIPAQNFLEAVLFGSKRKIE